MQTSIPATLGEKYRIMGLIGEGGFATVYGALDTSLDRHVAIKILDPLLLRDRTFLDRFRREARTVAGLAHPNIVAIYEIGQHEGQHFIVMPYLPGPSLARLIASQGALGVDQALRIGEQVGAALDYAHQRGLVHRDVKPGNIILDGQGNAILTDFGIARTMDQSVALTRTGTNLGTPQYMAPERWTAGRVDASADLYAFGIVLYQTLTGQVPFDGEASRIMYGHVQEAPPSPQLLNPSLPPAVEVVLVKALAKEPARRYQSAGELMANLRVALIGGALPVSAPAVSTSRLPMRWVLFGAASVTIAIALVGLVAWSALSATTQQAAADLTSVARARTADAVPVVTRLAREGTATAASRDAEATRLAEADMATDKAAAVRATHAAGRRTATAAANVAAAATLQTEEDLSAATRAQNGPTATAEARTTSVALANSTATVRATAKLTAISPRALPRPTATPAEMIEEPPSPMADQATPTPAPAVAISPTTTLPSREGKLAFSLPQGTRYKVYVIQVGPTPPKQLYSSVSDARQPALSHDGNWLLVNGTGGGLDAIGRLTSDGHQIEAITCLASTGESGRPIWSPDDRFLAFDGLAADPANPAIYIQRVDEVECELVDSRLRIAGGYVTDPNGLHPLWGPDGRIYFRSCATWEPQGGSNCGIWSVQPDGADVRQLTDNANQIPTDVSSDRLLLMSTHQGNWEVYSVGLQGGTVRNLTNHPTTEVWGTFSPDGRTLAYLSNRDGAWAIWLANADGSNPQEWLPINPDWGEVDPDRIAQERMSWSK